MSKLGVSAVWLSFAQLCSQTLLGSIRNPDKVRRHYPKRSKQTRRVLSGLSLLSDATCGLAALLMALCKR